MYSNILNIKLFYQKKNMINYANQSYDNLIFFYVFKKSKKFEIKGFLIARLKLIKGQQ